jgi:hypothetical protein
MQGLSTGPAVLELGLGLSTETEGVVRRPPKLAYANRRHGRGKSVAADVSRRIDPSGSPGPPAYAGGYHAFGPFDQVAFVGSVFLGSLQTVFWA